MTGRPAILGGTPVRAGKSWPAWPRWDDAERELLAQVLESGAWSTARGEQAARFAEELAEFEGARCALAVTNGAHAMEAALVACDVGEGDEVIVAALTFLATATAVLAVNATPVLVDVDPESLCLDVAAAGAAVTERTRAILPVHLAGTACDLDALVDLCNRRGLALVADCAHSHGTRWRGRGVGAFGDAGCFSFEAHKLVTAGEGGAVTTNDETLRARARSYADCGRVEGGHWYHHAGYGTNLRITEWQAAVLRAQLRRLPEQHRVRSERADLLDAELSRIPGLRPQAGDPRMDSRARYCFVFHYDAAEVGGLPLRSFEEALAAEGVAVGVSYPSLNALEVFRTNRFGPRLRAGAPRIDYSALSLPRAEHAAASTVWLDQRVLLGSAEDALDVVRAVARIAEHAPAIGRRVGRRGRLRRLATTARGWIGAS